MLYCDSHTHSYFSFDSEQSLEEMTSNAVKHGFDRIAVTDHYDIDGILDGFYDDYDADTAKQEIFNYRQNNSDRVDIVYGIELGQPHLRPTEAANFLRKYKFEFVIGSLHNLDKVPDYIFLNYTTMSDNLIRDLYRRYVEELSQLALFPGINTVAHITYPARYIHRDGKNIDLSEFYDSYKKLFKIIIDRGIALEINTSGLRKGHTLSPDIELIKLYREQGGELISCGSDAHRPPDMCADVKNTLSMLADMGFKYITYPSRNGTEQHKIDL